MKNKIRLALELLVVSSVLATPLQAKTTEIEKNIAPKKGIEQGIAIPLTFQFNRNVEIKDMFLENFYSGYTKPEYLKKVINEGVYMDPNFMNEIAIKIAHDEGRVDEALGLWNLCLKNSDNNEDKAVYNFNSALYFEMYKTNFEEAEKHYLDSLSLDPCFQYADALAGMYYKNGEYKKALEFWKRAVDLGAEPSEIATTCGHILGVLIHKEKNPKEARFYLGKILEMRPELKDAYFTHRYEELIRNMETK
jgi:tetratricopeptide (TPR) repeat protein